MSPSESRPRTNTDAVGDEVEESFTQKTIVFIQSQLDPSEIPKETDLFLSTFRKDLVDIRHLSQVHYGFSEGSLRRRIYSDFFVSMLRIKGQKKQDLLNRLLYSIRKDLLTKVYQVLLHEIAVSGIENEDGERVLMFNDCPISQTRLDRVDVVMFTRAYDDIVKPYAALSLLKGGLTLEQLKQHSKSHFECLLTFPRLFPVAIYWMHTSQHNYFRPIVLGLPMNLGSVSTVSVDSRDNSVGTCCFKDKLSQMRRTPIYLERILLAYSEEPQLPVRQVLQ